MPKRKQTLKLSKRLFAVILFASLMMLICVTAAVVAASWSVYEGDAEERLAAQAEKSAQSLAGLSDEAMVERLSALSPSDIRTTLIADDGAVLYDSHADASSLPNHASREEVVSAKDGKGLVVLRRSETMGEDRLYAAVPLDERGMVLRVSESRTSFPYYLGSLSFSLLGIVFFAILFSIIVSRLLTKRVSAPLLAIDLERPLESETYEEVEPLLFRIDTQREELLERNSQLQKSVVLRREFTANVSHEMKSPLQVIGGYAELIESGITGPQDTRRFAGLIHNEAQSMRMLIDDVLTLSRLDESVGIGAEVFDFSVVCRRVIERLSKPAQERGVTMVVRIENDLTAQGSESLAEQLVYNLVDNAIRHGRENGEVELSLEKRDERIRLSVCDDGPGIPPEARERVFERFYRLDPSRSRSTGGTGLGLAIAKHAAESMGGEVVLGDSPSGGCAFTVTIPC